jgi:hypothetical protein
MQEGHKARTYKGFRIYGLDKGPDIASGLNPYPFYKGTQESVGQTSAH